MLALSGMPEYDWSVTIADNGSHDSSWEIAQRIEVARSDVRAIRLEDPGRGRALKRAWTSTTADIFAYMDIDLSTSLDCLRPLIDPIAQGATDVSIGCRLAKKSEVARGMKREFISHAYNFIARRALDYPVKDAQCGFKAASRAVVEVVVPLVSDDSWFFDTELLVLAWRKGFRIKEIPVRWTEDEDSRVRIVATAIDDLRGIVRLMRDKRSRT